MAVPVDYSSSPGVVFSLVGSFSRPLFRTGKWQMGYALEEGLAFCTLPYAKEHNIDNELTGGHWLIHLELRFTRRDNWTSIGVCAVIWRSDT